MDWNSGQINIESARRIKTMCISKSTIRQLFKYGISGGIGAAIDFGVYSILVSIISMNYLLANAISFSIGTIVVYYLQKNWTFQYKTDKNAILFTKFFSVVIVTYLLNNLILIVCVELLHMNPIMAKIVQICISFLWGYTINKTFVFN